MNVERLSALLTKFQTIPPAALAEIVSFEHQACVPLPAEYRDFLLFTNGGEGFIGPNYTMFWEVEELLPFNREYQVEEYAPGLLLIGSSGGGEAFGFDFRVPGKSLVVSVPFVGMDLSETCQVGETFDEFLEYLAQQEQ